MTMEWTISIEGTNEFGDTIRREVRIDKAMSVCATMTLVCRSMMARRSWPPYK